MSKVCNDISTQANHGTYEGTVAQRVPGIIANGGGDPARYFDGSAFVSADAVVADLPAFGFSFGCWMMPVADFTAQTFGAGVLAFNSATGGGGFYGAGNRLILRFGGTGQPRAIYLTNDAPGPGVPSILGPTLSLLTVHFVVATLDRTLKLWVDGVPIGAAAQDAANDLQPSDLFTMAQEWDHPSPSDFYNGVLDEVFVLPRTITDGEVSRLWDVGTGAVASGDYKAEVLALDPVGYWRLNDGGWLVDSVGMA